MLETSRRLCGNTSVKIKPWFRLIVGMVLVHAGRAAEPEPVIPVAAQPLAANVSRLIDALDFLGAPLPGDLTLAGYAHRGAYPLIATALLAALFVLVTLRPGSETARSRGIKVLVTLWIAQNLLLVASTMCRTFDYIESYSLTVLRIAALILRATSSERPISGVMAPRISGMPARERSPSQSQFNW